MSVVTLEQRLADSLELERLRKGAGVTADQARAFLALMADTPIRQAIRICTTSKHDHVRRVNRETRRAERP